jgi:hypothetical protein
MIGLEFHKSNNSPSFSDQGLFRISSRGDKTGIELFMPGIRGLEGRIAAILRQVAG